MFQFLETAPWMMPKPIKDLESVLRFEKARILAIILDLVELLKSLQHVFERFGWIKEDCPFPVA